MYCCNCLFLHEFSEPPQVPLRFLRVFRAYMPATKLFSHNFYQVFTNNLEKAVIETVEAGHMTKDLAICVHGWNVTEDQYLMTEAFMDEIKVCICNARTPPFRASFLVSMYMFMCVQYLFTVWAVARSNVGSIVAREVRLSGVLLS